MKTYLMWPGRRAIGWMAGGLATVAVAAAVLPGSRAVPAAPPLAEVADESSVLVEEPPVTAAISTPYQTARLRASARVIGVTAGGRHRAYVVSALSTVRQHVVNDRLGKASLVVAYCDRTDCATAYATDAADPPAVAVGGWDESAGADHGMLLRVGRHRYRQKSARPVDADAPPFPLTGVEVERTTWGEWRAAHPDTDVCLRVPEGPAR